MQQIKKNEMTFIEHLVELRKRVVFSVLAIFIFSIVCFIYYDFIISFLMSPYLELETSQIGYKFVTSTILEGFLIKLKVSVISSLVCSFPLLVFHILRFSFPGLKKKEKKVIIYSLFFSTILIFLSIFYGYNIIIPISISFLTTNNFIPNNVGLLLNLEKNIFYIFQFIVICS